MTAQTPAPAMVKAGADEVLTVQQQEVNNAAHLCLLPSFGLFNALHQQIRGLERGLSVLR